jgi:hypothetical protein
MSLPGTGSRVKASNQMTAATTYPPPDTWITEDIWKEGLGWTLFSRELADKSIAVPVFLVDRLRGKLLSG